MNDFLNLLLRLPLPILVGGFIFVAWIFSKVFGANQTPIENRNARPALSAANRTPAQNSGPMPVLQRSSPPPPLPTKKGKRKKGTPSTRLQQAAAAAEEAQAAAHNEAAAKARAETLPPTTVQKPRDTPADSVRRYMQAQRGAKEAFMLFSVLDKPKSME